MEALSASRLFPNRENQTEHQLLKEYTPAVHDLSTALLLPSVWTARSLSTDTRGVCALQAAAAIEASAEARAVLLYMEIELALAPGRQGPCHSQG